MKKEDKCTCQTSDSVCSSVDCSNRINVTIEKSMPPLSYKIIEGNFKHLQGQILTVLEATMEGKKLDATKSLVKGFVNEKLTFLFEMCGNYGLPINQELPDYASDNMEEYVGASLES